MAVNNDDTGGAIHAGHGDGDCQAAKGMRQGWMDGSMLDRTLRDGFCIDFISKVCPTYASRKRPRRAAPKHGAF